MAEQNPNYENELEQAHFLRQLYNLQCLYVKRKNSHFSFVYLDYPQDAPVAYETFYELLNNELRHSDFAFAHTRKKYVALLLTISSVTEAKAFLHRLQTASAFLKIPIKSVIMEIANSSFSLEEILTKGAECITDPVLVAGEPFVVPDFSEKEQKRVKVSIIESDRITKSIFTNMLENIQLDATRLEVKTFQDGLDFIESDWYQSAHSHLVILNDILPRKNGLEVLHYLRRLPNERKYIIFFISTRQSEEAQLQCFENGADGYFVRPFNLKIMETQMKNYLRRLR